LERLNYDRTAKAVTYRFDKADGTTAGTETVDPLEFLARLLADRGFPAALAATVPVFAARPVCESTLPAAVFAAFVAFVAFGLVNTRAAAVAAFAPVLRTATIASGMPVNETATIRYAHSAANGYGGQFVVARFAGLRWRRPV